MDNMDEIVVLFSRQQKAEVAVADGQTVVKIAPPGHTVQPITDVDK